MNTALLLLVSCYALLATATEKRGTEYYTKPQAQPQGQAYSFSHFKQDLPANEGLLRLLPSAKKAPLLPSVRKAPAQHLAVVPVVPVYLQHHVPVMQVPVIARLPLVHQRQGQAKPNTFPHLRPYYKQLDE